MEKDTFFDKVAEFISENLSVPLEKVTPEASFINDLGADSLDITEAIMSAEKEWNIELPDDETKGLTTVQNFVDLLRRKKGEV